jgi:hypothetical protein
MDPVTQAFICIIVSLTILVASEAIPHLFKQETRNEKPTTERKQE